MTTPALPVSRFRIPHLRWVIGVMLLFASILNYVDRQALSILAPTIQNELKITDGEYANIVSAFLVAYTIAFLLSGRIADLLGTRVGLALFVGWWSLANALTGLARGAFSMGVFRFFLGLGEAGGYTTSPKVVAEWFPPKERGIAVGLYSVGGAVGATIAPLLVIGLAARFGWQAVFLVTGLMGFVFVAFWLILFRPLQTHPLLSEKERELILHDRPAVSEDVPKLSGRVVWGKIIRSPVVWVIMLGRLLTDPVWYFYQFWMPKYLHSERGFEQHELASMWVIFLAADVGFLISGFISARFIKRGSAPGAARLRVMRFCAILAPAGLLVPFMPGSATVFTVSMIVVLAHAAWLTSITTYAVDLIPARILGTAIGFMGAGSALGGIAMNQAVPWVVSHFSYNPCFYAMLVVHPLAYTLIHLFGRKPVEID